jgi:hypothetical protein
MKKYRDDIKTIFQVLSFIALYFLFSMIDNLIVAIISGVFWLFVWSLNIYDKIKYRSKKYPNEIRFPTQNDSYFKITSLSLGGMLTVGMIIWLTLMTEYTLIPVFGLLAGILILINGIIDVPKGQLKFDNSNLKLIGIKEGVEISDIRYINIDNDMITVHKDKDSSVKLDRLELNEKWISKISDFLKLKLNNDEVKITCGNTM